MHNFPFQRLQADLAKLIEHTPPGQRLLNEPDLAKQMGVSRATLREAMRGREAGVRVSVETLIQYLLLDRTAGTSFFIPGGLVVSEQVISQFRVIPWDGRVPQDDDDVRAARAAAIRSIHEEPW